MKKITNRINIDMKVINNKTNNKDIHIYTNFEDRWKNKSIKSNEDLNHDLVDHYSHMYKYKKSLSNITFEIINENCLDYLINNFWKIYDKKDKNNIQFHNYNYNKLRLLKILNNKGIYPSYYKQNDIKCRQYIINNIGIQSFERNIRGALCKDLYIDIDLKNCHPNILYKICLDYKLECPKLKLYIENSNQYRNELISINENKDKNLSKLAFIKILCGMKLGNIKLNKTQFLKDFYNEFQDLTTKLTATEIYKQALKDRLEQNKKYKMNGFIKVKTVISDMCRRIENNILESCKTYLTRNKIIDSKNPVYILMYDGIMVLKNPNLNMEELNNYIQKKYKYKYFKFIKKEINTNIKNIPKFNEDLLEKIKDLKILNKIGFFRTQRSILKSAIEPKKNINTNNIIKADKIINQKYIECVDDFENNDTIFIKSNMGTGKTVNVYKFIRDHPNKKILITTFRRSLGSKYYKDLKKDGFKYYENLDSHQTNAEDCPKVIVQINSLYHFNGKYDYVILDEFSYTYNMIFSFCDNKDNVFNALNSFIKHSEKVIILDALLKNNNITYINYYRENKKSLIIHNKYEIKKLVKLYEKDALTSKLIKSFKNYDKSKKVVIASNSKTWIDKKIIPMMEEYKIDNYIYICKDTIDDLNIGEIKWEDYDYILYTPTITCGVSIEIPIDDMYCYFTSRSCPADICYQMMGRVRNLKNNIYHITISQTNSMKYPILKKDIIKYLNEYRNLGYKCLNYLFPQNNNNKNKNFIDKQKLIYDNYNSKYKEDNTFNGLIQHIINVNRSKNDLLSEFDNLVTSIGYKIQPVIQSHEKIESICKEKIKNKAIYNAYNDNLLNVQLEDYQDAELIETEKEYNELNNKLRKTKLDKIKLNTYNINSVCDKPVNGMNKKELKYIIENYKGIFFKKFILDNLNGKDLKQYLNNKILDLQFDTNRNLELNTIEIKKRDDLQTINQRKRDFYIKTLTACEVAEILNGGCDLGENIYHKEIDISENIYEVFSNYVNENIKIITLLFDKKEISIKNYKEKKKFNDYKILNSLLRYVGLKVYNVRVTKKGERIRKPFLKYIYILNPS